MTTTEPQIVDMPHLASQWARIRVRLQTEVGDAEYRTWLRQMTLAGIDGDEVTVTLPTRFLRDWVTSRYGDRIKALWQAENPAVRRVDVRVGTAMPLDISLAESLSAPRDHVSRDGAAPDSEPTPAPSIARDERIGRTERPLRSNAQRRNGIIHLGINSRCVRPRCIRHRLLKRQPPARPIPPCRRGGSRRSTPGAGRGARSALHLRRFRRRQAKRIRLCLFPPRRRTSVQPGFNPLFLYGGVGLGKTHLMHAIAWELTDRTAAPVSVAYMSAEKFMYRFIAAIRSQSTMEFKEHLRNVDVLMIDDLQFLIGKDNTQEEFFHTFNYLVEAGKQIVVSADKSPSDLSGLEHRLRTRLGCGMVADLHTTTYELRISILEAKAARAGVAVPVKVMEFLAHKITSNVRELEGALNRLVAHANLFGRPVTLEATHEVLHDILKAHDRRVTIEEIQKKVAEHYSIRLTDMSSARRARAVARPRQVAMFLAKQLTSRSLPEIGRKFGNRDHTTVMHAVSRVTELMQRDGTFAEDVELLRRLLES